MVYSRENDSQKILDSYFRLNNSFANELYYIYQHVSVSTSIKECNWEINKILFLMKEAMKIYKSRVLDLWIKNSEE